MEERKETELRIAFPISSPVRQILVSQCRRIARCSPIVEVRHSQAKLDRQASIRTIAYIQAQPIAWECVVVSELSRILIVSEKALPQQAYPQTISIHRAITAGELLSTIVILRPEGTPPAQEEEKPQQATAKQM